MNKNDSKKISIIVPIYNVEKYLDKCLESLLNQTYKNIEIVCVEDCSTDSSRDVLNKYRNNKKIKIVLNKNNSGLSFSRNEGLKHATGDYIGFVDSDDYVDADYYEKMMETIINDNSDLAIADIKTVFEKENYEMLNKAYNESQDSLGFINNGLAASACNKLFKKNLIKKYEFEVGKVNEDLAVIIPTIVSAKKVSYVENAYYYYVQRNNSIQNSQFSDKRFDIVYGVDLTLERIKGCDNYEKIKDAIIFNQIILFFIYVIPKINNIFVRARVIRKYNKLTKKYKIRENIYFWRFLDQSGKKYRIYYKLLFKLMCNGFSLMTSLCIFIFNVAKKLFKAPVIKKFNDADLVKKAKNNGNYSDYGLKISVVIPNYNYARFIGQRLYSVLSQKVKIYELIILDDNSKDNSMDIIDYYCNLINPYINVKKIYNSKNSGSAFSQWKKGFENATGDYVWIAEADDYCDSNLLRELINPLKLNKNIVISYADTAFIDSDGRVIVKSIRPEIDIQKTGHWNNSFVNDGLSEIRNYMFLNCTIANVSSALIKNDNYDNYLKLSSNYRQAGDWLFYVNAVSRGSIAFINKPLNYYRVHGNNVSSVMNSQKHIEEILSIYEYINSKFKIKENGANLQKERISFLKKVWGVK